MAAPMVSARGPTTPRPTVSSAAVADERGGAWPCNGHQAPQAGLQFAVNKARSVVLELLHGL
jgi:hypothetical protein